MKTIAVIGSGYVGVTTAAIAANSGYKVHLIDVNPARVDVLKTGKSFFYEEGIDNLLTEGIKSGNLLPSTDYSPGIAEAELIFSCVGTPDNPDGTSNLSYVFQAAKTAAETMKNDAIYIQKSTVPVGTGRKVIKLLPDSVRYVSNPEFLREGTAVFDTLFFDRIVVGSDDKNAAKTVAELYEAIQSKREETASLAAIDRPEKVSPEKYIVTNLESAELIKVTANAFLALKISFANSIAKLADEASADVIEVMDGVGADLRIGRAFLNAGRGYGGGCFPKDVSGLIGSAADFGVDMPILTAAQEVNASMPGYIASKAQAKLGTLTNKKVAVLGLAFKAGTSDARKSPGVKIANILNKSGASVKAYDPHANGEAREELYEKVKTCDTIDEAIRDADAIFIATDWPIFKELDLTYTAKLMNGKLLVDCMNCIDRTKAKAAKLDYLGVGR